MKLKKEILEHLKKTKKPLTTHDISKSMKKSWHSIQNRMLSLEMEGKVKRKRLKRIHLWKIKEEVGEAPIPPEEKEEVLKHISKERRKVKEVIERAGEKPKQIKQEYVWTGVEGLDKLLHKGIPKGNTQIIAGGTGSGKTILTLQIMHNALESGRKCLYMTLEESEEKLISHMHDFGWEAQKFLKNGQLIIYRLNTFDLKRSVDALLAKTRGELMIDVQPVILPKKFQPEFIFVDSLTAIAATFVGKEEAYRIYIEQFFRYLETTGATSFLISETDQIPTKYSPTGVEEFLADGVIILYSFKIKNEKVRALEILKLRGAGHERKIVTFTIEDTKGIKIFPSKEIFTEL